MAGDPFKVFMDAPDSHREMLKTLWPELYASLAPASDTVRPLTCVLGSCPFTKPRPVAVGRITRNGHPACRKHIATAADRVGGWPLKLILDRPEE